MQTQRAAKAAPTTYLVPPITMAFTISQQHKNRCLIEVSVLSGRHLFLRRELEAFYDTFGEIPVMIGSSMLSWTLWFVQFEAERRLSDPGQRKQLQLHFPDWPSPIHHEDDKPDVQF